MFFYSKMFIAHTGYLELFDLVVKHILPGMGLFFTLCCISIVNSPSYQRHQVQGSILTVDQLCRSNFARFILLIKIKLRDFAQLEISSKMPSNQHL